MEDKELKNRDIVIRKGRDLVYSPELSLYYIAGAILMTTPSEYGPEEDGYPPHIDIFPLEEDTWEHRLEQWVKVLDEILWAMGPTFNEHERKVISITIKEREKYRNHTDAG
ncbi:MAG: hypothetical protein GWN97_00440 [Thermoplasmata archaeon]|nr:hypothetical protein [Thermoplasmata archaeon]NIS10430.1 hypothetical protein [Thermoplasmata archaeon]